MVGNHVERGVLVFGGVGRLTIATHPARAGGQRITGIRGVLRSRSAPVWALGISLWVAAAALAPSVISMPAPRGLRVPFWALALAFYLTEVYVVHIEFRRDAESFSLSEIPLVFGLFFAAPGTLLAAQVAGALLALAWKRKQPPVKLVFNLGHLALETEIAALLFRHITGGSLAHGRVWPAAFAASGAAMLVGVTFVVAVISLSERSMQRRMVPQVLSLGSIVAVTNTCLALVGVEILHARPSAAWLLVVPAIVLFLAYRAYSAERRKHQHLDFLYGATSLMQAAPDVPSTVECLLAQARTMFRAEIAEVTIFPRSPGGAGFRAASGPGSPVASLRSVSLDPAEGIWARIASEAKPILLAKPIENARLHRHFAARGIRDAIAAPLQVNGAIFGMVMVANRLGDLTTFTQDDLRLFETLSNQAGVSLENARLVTELRESLEKANELNRLKDEFVATISHELRTPLTGIQGSVKTLLRPELIQDDAQARLFLEVIDRQSDRLRRLIEDLLRLSRVESDTVEPHRSRAGCRELAVQAIDDAAAKAKGHALELRIGDEPPVLDTDRELIRCVLANLLENAIKYSPEGTSILLSSRTDGSGVRFTVEDEGDGVPLELRERIFDRFFQADQSSTRRVGGVGLGLYICKRLATALGGRIWVGESPAGGAAFHVWLPLEAPERASAPRKGDAAA